MRHRIQIFRPVTTADDSGGRSTRWELDSTLWADILRPRFADTTAEGSHSVILTQGILIRRHDVRQGWRVVLSGDSYSVIHVDDSQAGETTLTCKEVSK